MPQFQFTLRCAANGSLRIDDIIAFLDLMGATFDCPEWVDADGCSIHLTSQHVEQCVRGLKPPADLERFGAAWVAVPKGGEPPVVLKMGVGGSQWTPNFFTADFTQLQSVPPLHFFREAIERIAPLEAFVFEQSNMNKLVSRRQSAPGGGRRNPPFALHWFHYFCGDYVIAFGGFSHCLRTPAYRVERFSDGVLFQLTTEPFDPERIEHCDIQVRAMEYLGLETSGKELIGDNYDSRVT